MYTIASRIHHFGTVQREGATIKQSKNNWDLGLIRAVEVEQERAELVSQLSFGRL
jgi:hypothetical protein